MQDEQYRLQNQTLMQELTVLVQTNEGLEQQLNTLQKSQASGTIRIYIIFIVAELESGRFDGAEAKHSWESLRG